MNRHKLSLRFFLILTAVLCLLLTGCGKEGKKDPGESSGPEPVTEVGLTPQPVLSSETASLLPEMSAVPSEAAPSPTPEVTPIPEPVAVL